MNFLKLRRFTTYHLLKLRRRGAARRGAARRLSLISIDSASFRSMRRLSSASDMRKGPLASQKASQCNHKHLKLSFQHLKQQQTIEFQSRKQTIATRTTFFFYQQPTGTTFFFYQQPSSSVKAHPDSFLCSHEE